MCLATRWCVPLATNDRTCLRSIEVQSVWLLIWHKKEINYVPEKHLSWLIICSAGAVAIDADGIVKITTDES